jgi:hypothetical protein
MNIFRRNKSAALLTMGMAALGSSAVHADSINANATATVIVPITITESQALDFGALAAGTGGTVTISTAGARSATGAVVLSSMDVGQNGIFDVAGQANYTYAITLPTVDQTLISGANSMVVNAFTSNPAGTGTLDGAGAQTINVGATLTVSSGQAPGSYAGTYPIAVEYN